MVPQQAQPVPPPPRFGLAEAQRLRAEGTTGSHTNIRKELNRIAGQFQTGYLIGGGGGYAELAHSECPAHLWQPFIAQTHLDILRNTCVKRCFWQFRSMEDRNRGLYGETPRKGNAPCQQRLELIADCFDGFYVIMHPGAGKSAQLKRVAIKDFEA